MATSTKPPESLSELGRFSEPPLHVLISLAEAPKHGYAMTEDIERLTGQRPGPGTLYGAIARLEAKGWIGWSCPVMAIELVEKNSTRRAVEDDGVDADAVEIHGALPGHDPLVNGQDQPRASWLHGRIG